MSCVTVALECVFDYADPCGIFCHIDNDHVESELAIFQSPSGYISFGGFPDLVPFFRVDGVFSDSEHVAFSGLDLAKHDRAFLFDDQVYFCAVVPEITFEYLIPLLAQELLSQPLTFRTEDLTHRTSPQTENEKLLRWIGVKPCLLIACRC